MEWNLVILMDDQRVYNGNGKLGGAGKRSAVVWLSGSPFFMFNNTPPFFFFFFPPKKPRVLLVFRWRKGSGGNNSRPCDNEARGEYTLIRKYLGTPIG